MKDRLSVIAFVLILGTILTTALVIANDFTAPIIEKNQELKLKSSVLDAFGIDYSKNDLEETFSQNIQILKKNKLAFYIYQNKGVAFEFSGKGLWGPIRGILALQPELERIKGIKIIHQEETPGLGGRIGEEEYLNKFENKKLIPSIKILSPDKVNKDNEVDAITGATLSCNAFEQILNNEYQKYKPLISNLLDSNR